MCSALFCWSRNTADKTATSQHHINQNDSPDECERVKAAGARVLTLDQVEGLKDPTVDCWTTEEEDDGDPPRLWFANAMYPGTAFTRSIGDAGARRWCLGAVGSGGGGGVGAEGGSGGDIGCV